MRSPPPDLGRLRLRPWSDDDAHAVAQACQDAEIQRWLPRLPVPYRFADALAYVRGDAVPGEVSVAFTVDGGVAGAIGMSPEADAIGRVGYWCAPEHRGRGWTSQALLLFAAHAFGGLGIERLELIVEPANAASLRVAAKAGFAREGLLRSYLRRRDGQRADVWLCSLLPTDVPPVPTT